ARRAYEEALALAKEDARVELEVAPSIALAQLAYARGALAEARGHVDAAIRADDAAGTHESREPLRIAALIDLRAGGTARAEESARAAVEAARNEHDRDAEADALVVLGRALSAAGRASEAEAELGRALSASPNAGARVRIARAAHLRGVGWIDAALSNA